MVCPSSSLKLTVATVFTYNPKEESLLHSSTLVISEILLVYENTCHCWYCYVFMPLTPLSPFPSPIFPPLLFLHFGGFGYMFFKVLGCFKRQVLSFLSFTTISGLLAFISLSFWIDVSRSIVLLLLLLALSSHHHHH